MSKTHRKPKPFNIRGNMPPPLTLKETARKYKMSDRELRKLLKSLREISLISESSYKRLLAEL